jgi:lipopolysaccharide transport system permease protein
VPRNKCLSTFKQALSPLRGVGKLGIGFISLWQYRGFIVGSVKREFQAKYRSSLLGGAWTVIGPLSMILVYTVIFSSVMQAKIPGSSGSRSYGIYLCAGILSWGLFSEIVSRSQNVFLDNANLIKKLSFPRLCLPIIVIISAGLNFIIIFSLFTAYLGASGSFPGVAFFSILPLTLILGLFAIGLGITLGVLNVFFRDVGQLSSIILQFWFWFTPIVYSVNIVPVKIRHFLALNPLTPIIAGFQKAIVLGMWPEWQSLIYPLSCSILLCIAAYRLFHGNIADIVDEL